jgi:hypothetical protein
MEHPPVPARAAAVSDVPPAWRPWYGFVAFLAALTCTVIAVGVLAGIFGGLDDDSATLTVVATLLQGVFFVGAALVFAGFVAPPRPWHFGLRRGPLWRTIGWAAGGMVTFYVFTATYAALVQPDAEQDVTEQLGAEDGTLGLIAAGVVVMMVAPLVEELFFRGFFYRALRTRYPIALAAIVDGVVFGAIHWDGDGADGLLLLPPLALLGVVFCLVYERTGTLWSVIGMHAFNNAVAFSAQVDDGWRVAVFVGPLMLVACAVVPRLLADGPWPFPRRDRGSGQGAQLSLPVE